MAALKNFLAIYPKSPEAPLDLTKPELAQLITEDMKADFPPGEEIFVARVSIAVPLPGSYKKIVMGNISDQAVTDFLHQVHGDADTNWFACLLPWTKSSQDIYILKTKAFETYLTKACSNTNLYGVSFVQQTISDLEDDDSLVNAAEHLELDCGKMFADVKWTCLEQRAPLLGKTLSLVHTESGSQEDIPDVPRADKAQALHNHIQCSLLLLSANFKKSTTQRLSPGKLSALAQLVIYSSSQNEMAAMAHSGMSTTEDVFEQSVHFLLHKVNPQQHQPVMEAYLPEHWLQ